MKKIQQDPEFSTDVSDKLMHLTVDADESAAIVVLMRDGSYYTRKANDVTHEVMVGRLREVADSMEEENT